MPPTSSHGPTSGRTMAPQVDSAERACERHSSYEARFGGRSEGGRVTTTEQVRDLTTTHSTRVRRGPAAALSGGAFLVSAALSMHLRGGIDDVAFIRRVEEAPQTWLTGHVLMAFGAILLMLGLLAVPSLVGGRGRRAVLVGTGLSAVGAASTALGDFAHGALAYVLIGDVPVEQSLEIQEQFFTQPLLAGVSMPGMLLPVGLLVIGGGLLWSRAVPVPAAVLVLVSPIAVQVGYTVTSLPMPLMVLPLVVSLVWIALVLARGDANPTRLE